MKHLLFCLALAACTTASVAAGPDGLRGCWIERAGAETKTMRWFAAESGAWRGDQLTYHNGDEPQHQGYRLEPGDPDGRAAWRLCPIDDGLMHGPPCLPAFLGRGDIREEGVDWFELKTSPDRFALILVRSHQRTPLFDGRRDGCD